MATDADDDTSANFDHAQQFLINLLAMNGTKVDENGVRRHGIVWRAWKRNAKFSFAILIDGVEFVIH